MSDDLNEVVNNVKRGSSWLRILFMIGFCVALYVAGIVVIFVTIAQALFSLITGTDNSNLRRLGSALTAYVGEVLSFLTYNSEIRPFPFSPFPEVPDPEPEPEDEDMDERAVQPAEADDAGGEEPPPASDVSNESDNGKERAAREPGATQADSMARPEEDAKEEDSNHSSDQQPKSQTAVNRAFSGISSPGSGDSKPGDGSAANDKSTG